MKGTYCHTLTEDVSVLFFYEYIVDDSGDYHTPNGGATLDIHKVELTDGVSVVDITSCIDDLCGLRITDIEDLIKDQYL
jgi:hypothetical protein